MTCQAYGCSTRPSNGKSLHSFPDPVKKKELCQTWIYNLNLQEASFTSTKNKVVCEDHFETSCFEGNMMGRLLGFTSKLRRLKSDAVPTVFAFDQNCRVYSNQQTRKRVLIELKPIIVDVGVQTLSPQQLQTDLSTSSTDHNYFQTTFSTQPLDTAFISSPQKDSNASDESKPSPPPSPEKPDSDYSYVPSDESHESNQSTSSDSSQQISTEPKCLHCLHESYAQNVELQFLRTNP
ncbi:unnamed protein product [Mytilus edulis]|uniref:THAP-type domain-containing protein n=1 Tax=Mytilus edulis TaxID=6550 RepID=A0A8S3PZR7_MYTED|nr:unnamed protein product [Mytilus edulis]